MRVRLSKHSPSVDKTDFAHVIAHECAHIRGMTHRQMGFPYRECQSRIRDRMRDSEDVRRVREYFAWAETLPLEVKPKKVKTVDVREQRFQKVLEAQKRWTTKFKRAQTALRKLARQRRYYERALATCKTPSAED